MITEKTLQPIFSDINPNNKTISIAIDTVILKNGEEIARERNRMAFVPGEIDKVKNFIGATEGPEVDYLNAIWTADVIAAHQALMEAEGQL